MNWTCPSQNKDCSPAVCLLRAATLCVSSSRVALILWIREKLFAYTNSLTRTVGYVSTADSPDLEEDTSRWYSVWVSRKYRKGCTGIEYIVSNAGPLPVDAFALAEAVKLSEGETATSRPGGKDLSIERKFAVGFQSWHRLPACDWILITVRILGRLLFCIGWGFEIVDSDGRSDKNVWLVREKFGRQLNRIGSKIFVGDGTVTNGSRLGACKSTRDNENCLTSPIGRLRRVCSRSDRLLEHSVRCRNIFLFQPTASVSREESVDWSYRRTIRESLLFFQPRGNGEKILPVVEITVIESGWSVIAAAKQRIDVRKVKRSNMNKLDDHYKHKNRDSEVHIVEPLSQWFPPCTRSRNHRGQGCYTGTLNLRCRKCKRRQILRNQNIDKR